MELVPPSTAALPARTPNASGGSWIPGVEPTVGPSRCAELGVLPGFVEWSICSAFAALLVAALLCMCLFCYYLRFQTWVISCVQPHEEDAGDDFLNVSTTPRLMDRPEPYGNYRPAAQPVGHPCRGRSRLSGTMVFSAGSLQDGGSSSSEAIFEIEDLS